MYKIYLIDSSSTPNSGASFGGSSPMIVNVANKIEISTTALGLNFQKGYYLKYQNVYYEIQSYAYNAVYSKYVVSVSGNPPIGPFTGAWSVHIPTNIVNDYILLDTEDVELETDFAVSDIADIGSRKDTITKNITIKGTNSNNQAFGHLYYQNRKADDKIVNRLFSNYTPLRTVRCQVFEDSILILDGNMLVTEVDYTDGTLYYQCTITGNIINLKTTLADKLLTDLSMIDLKHQYVAQNILDSWGGHTSDMSTQVGLSRTQRYNATTDTYSYVDYEAGSGYVYPFIDYGDKFKNNDLNIDYNTWKLQNYRPSVWVKEYLNRIFTQSGFTYEVKGSPTLIERFNHLIIPNSDEGFINAQVTNRLIYTKSTTQNTTYNKAPDTVNKVMAVPFKWDVQDNTYLTDWSAQYGDGSPSSNREHNLLIAKRTFTSDARIQATGSVSGNTGGAVDIVHIQLVKRDFTTSTLLEPTKFTVIAEQTFTVSDGEVKSWSVDFVAPSTTFNVTDQLQVRAYFPIHDDSPGPGGEYWSTVNIDTATFEMSSSAQTPYTVSVELDDYITPKAPEGIKQFDFLKSIINMMNFYVYTEQENPNHFIFETYDDYYALTDVGNVVGSSLNWTHKLDYKSDFKIKSNLNIPKNYVFTYKEDSDYYNGAYKDKFDEVYGQLNFTDNLGITDEKSVELIFSPSPQSGIGATGRVFPMFVKTSDTLATKEMTKTNIRILYYNGLHFANYLWSSIDTFDSGAGTWGKTEVFGSPWYPNVSMYWFNTDTRNVNSPFDGSGNAKPLEALTSLLWNTPKEYYFLLNQSYITASNLYRDFYINQTTELTNINLVTIELGLTLNANDIQDIDLSIPVYMNFDNLGYAYYKVLKIEYSNQKAVSTVTLQKIII